MWVPAKVAWWWAAGSVVVLGPLIASAWTANRDPRFYPALLIVASIGVVAGLSVHDLDTPSVVRLSRLPPSLVVVTAFPMSVIGAVLVDAERDLAPAEVLLWMTVAVVIGSIAILVRFTSRHPGLIFHRAAWLWLAASVLFVPIYGAGLGLLPLAVSCWLAGRTLGRGPVERLN